MKVAELIAKLTEFPGDAPVVIIDADTLCDLARFSVSLEKNGSVALSGSYTEPDDDDAIGDAIIREAFGPAPTPSPAGKTGR